MRKPLKSLACPYCGTQWDYREGDGPKGGWSGFLQVQVRNHIYRCRQWSPLDRRNWARRMEDRLARKPNQHTEVIFDYDHPGMKVGAQ